MRNIPWLLPLTFLWFYGTSPSASAAPPPATERYGDPVAEPECGRLAAHVEHEIERVVAELGLPPVSRDPRLAAALLWLGQRPERPRPPNHTQIEEALRHVGSVELPTAIQIFLAHPQATADLRKEVYKRMRALFQVHRPTRIAACELAPTPGSTDPRREVLVTYAEGQLEIGPLPKRFALGQQATLTLRLSPGLTEPTVVVAAAEGKIDTQPLKPDAANPADGRYSTLIGCTDEGVNTLEIVAQGAQGAVTLARFPVQCGSAKTALLVPGAGIAPAPAQPWRSVGEAAERLAAMIDEARERVHLPPVPGDENLDTLAREHCLDMIKNHFIGHRSPTTGKISDRLERAGLAKPKILHESIAVGVDPQAILAGLLESPSSRSALLNPLVNRTGLGVVATQRDGQRVLLVTQVFAYYPSLVPLPAARERLLAAIRQSRTEEGLAPLVEDDELNRLAEEAAHAVATGTKTAEAVNLAQIAGRLRRPVRDRAVSYGHHEDVTAIELPPPKAIYTHLGVGIDRETDKKGRSRFHYVVLFFRFR